MTFGIARAAWIGAAVTVATIAGIGARALLVGPDAVSAAPARATASAKPRVAAHPSPVSARTARRTPQPPTAAAPAPAPAYVIKHILPIDGAMHHGDWYWDEKGTPAGPIIITVDLKAQVLSIFRDGYEIGTAVILFGADAKPTPVGVYPITQKDADHVSNIYKGAPMPYMLRLTNDGISIHASTVTDGYMTHGCIGVPKAFARKLFDAVKLGDRVIVTNGETLTKGAAVTAL